jgi:hypothetical protein
MAVLPDTAGVPSGTIAANAATFNADHTSVVGFAIWERQFEGQAGNYGRMVEHSTVSSAR